MGQAQLKKQRIDALRSISVGPGSFMEQPRGALVLLARLDDDSRLRSAIQDVIQNPAGALRLIDGLDATTAAKVGWAVVVHAYGAWAAVMWRAADSSVRGLRICMNSRKETKR